MTKEQFENLDLTPEPQTLSAIIKGMQEIDKRNKAFKSRFSVDKK